MGVFIPSTLRMAPVSVVALAFLVEVYDFESQGSQMHRLTLKSLEGNDHRGHITSFGICFTCYQNSSHGLCLAFP